MTDLDDEDDDAPLDSVISLHRSSGGVRDLLRPYRILLDGGEIGRISRGQTFEFDVQPGPHTLRLAVDDGSSALASVDLAAGERAAFGCGPNRAAGPEGPRIALARREAESRVSPPTRP